jgi:hypothetical protein
MWFGSQSGCIEQQYKVQNTRVDLCLCYSMRGTNPRTPFVWASCWNLHGCRWCFLCLEAATSSHTSSAYEFSSVSAKPNYLIIIHTRYSFTKNPSSAYRFFCSRRQILQPRCRWRRRPFHPLVQVMPSINRLARASRLLVLGARVNGMSSFRPTGIGLRGEQPPKELVLIQP